MKFNYNNLESFYILLDQNPSEIEEFIISMNFLNPFALILPASFIYEQQINVHKITKSPYRDTVNSYAERMTFFEWISGIKETTIKNKDNYYPILRIDLNKYVRDLRIG